MPTLLRNVLAIVVATFAAVSLTVLTAVPATGAVAFTVSGTRILHDPPFPEQLLPGFFTGATISRVDYPAAVFGMDRSIAIAVQGITQAVRDSEEPAIAAGFSQGALAVTYAKKELMALPESQRPASDRLAFITIGDPSGAGGILKSLRFRVPLIGLTPVTSPDTPYNTVVVHGEYDGWADFPDRPWNLVAVANALLGIVYVHGGYETIPGGLDLTAVPAANITASVNSMGGSTTTYLIPTGKLPLVQPLRDLGVSERIVTALEKPLKKMVDKSYRRNDMPSPAVALPDIAAPSAAATARSAPRQKRQPQRRSAEHSGRRSPGRAAAAA